MPEVLLASGNARKLGEMQRILGRLVPELRVLGLPDVPAYDEPVEDAPTFSGNALLKARAGLAASGLPTLADDSGLRVDELNGMPGVLSARWSGRPRDDHRNNVLLLDQLADVPDVRRGAHFTCALALCTPDGREQVVEGHMRGRIVHEPRGLGGFGYDVVFCAEGHDVTTAELDADEKDRVSHRGMAMREMAPLVAAALGG